MCCNCCWRWFQNEYFIEWKSLNYKTDYDDEDGILCGFLCGKRMNIVGSTIRQLYRLLSVDVHIVWRWFYIEFSRTGFIAHYMSLHWTTDRILGQYIVIHNVIHRFFFKLFLRWWTLHVFLWTVITFLLCKTCPLETRSFLWKKHFKETQHGISRAHSRILAKTDSWFDYIEMLEQYFTANDIASEQTDKRRAILLSSCGSITYSLIKKTLVAPKLPKDKTFDEISKTVGDYYEPKPSSILEGFWLNTRVCHTNESVAAYVAALRGIAQNCEFPNIDERLCDRLVVGINNESVQCRLLAEPKLTFKSAFVIAQSMEVCGQEYVGYTWCSCEWASFYGTERG